MRIEPPEHLAGEGVALRPLRADDAGPFVGAFRADPDLGRLLGIEQDPDEDAFLESSERRRQRTEEGSGLMLAVADPDTDAFWGAAGLHNVDWHHRRCEVGFWLIPAVRGRGVGSRAVALIVTWAFGALDLLRVEMTTTPDNAAAAALARRLGFTREGVLRKRNIERRRRIDVVWFGVLREEWNDGPARLQRDSPS